MPYWPVRYPDHRNSSHGSRIHRGLLWFKCTWSKQLDSQHSMLTHFYYPTNALHYTNLEVKIDVVQKFKRLKIKNHSDMFRILCDRSSWSTELCLTEITRSDSRIFCRVLGSVILNLWCVCVYGPAGWTVHTHTHTTGSKLRCQTPTKHTTKYLWTTLSNFSQVQLRTPWWLITYDPKHVGVIFNFCVF